MHDTCPLYWTLVFYLRPCSSQSFNRAGNGYHPPALPESLVVQRTRLPSPDSESIGGPGRTKDFYALYNDLS